MKTKIQKLVVSMFLTAIVFTGCGGDETTSPVFTTQRPPPFCTPESFEPCYNGDLETLNIGICKGGFRRCLSDGSGFGICEEEVLPEKSEICDDLKDNDCNGVVDKDCHPSCQFNEDCGSGDICWLAECQEGYCAKINLPETTEFNQILGDCKKEKCDGMGNLITININDAPIIECYSSHCSNGKVMNFPSSMGTSCTLNGGQKCDGEGNCVQCNTNANCPSGQVCVSNQCI